MGLYDKDDAGGTNSLELRVRDCLEASAWRKLHASNCLERMHGMDSRWRIVWKGLHERGFMEGILP
jgi:hypothetical protein